MSHPKAFKAAWVGSFPILRFVRQRWSPRGHPWPQVRPIGQNLKSLALASKPSNPRKYPVLGSRTTFFFDLLKMSQGHDQLTIFGFEVYV